MAVKQVAVTTVNKNPSLKIKEELLPTTAAIGTDIVSSDVETTKPKIASTTEETNITSTVEEAPTIEPEEAPIAVTDKVPETKNVSTANEMKNEAGIKEKPSAMESEEVPTAVTDNTLETKNASTTDEMKIEPAIEEKTSAMKFKKELTIITDSEPLLLVREPRSKKSAQKTVIFDTYEDHTLDNMNSSILSQENVEKYISRSSAVIVDEYGDPPLEEMESEVSVGGLFDNLDLQKYLPSPSESLLDAFIPSPLKQLPSPSESLLDSFVPSPIHETKSKSDGIENLGQHVDEKKDEESMNREIDNKNPMINLEKKEANEEAKAASATLKSRKTAENMTSWDLMNSQFSNSKLVASVTKSSDNDMDMIFDTPLWVTGQEEEITFSKATLSNASVKLVSPVQNDDSETKESHREKNSISLPDSNESRKSKKTLEPKESAMDTFDMFDTSSWVAGTESGFSDTSLSKLELDINVEKEFVNMMKEEMKHRTLTDGERGMLFDAQEAIDGAEEKAIINKRNDVKEDDKPLIGQLATSNSVEGSSAINNVPLEDRLKMYTAVEPDEDSVDNSADNSESDGQSGDSYNNEAEINAEYVNQYNEDEEVDEIEIEKSEEYLLPMDKSPICPDDIPTLQVAASAASMSSTQQCNVISTNSLESGENSSTHGQEAYDIPKTLEELKMAIPPPPPPPPGVPKKKKKKKKKSKKDVPLIAPPPVEKMKQWEEGQLRAENYVTEMKERLINSETKAFGASSEYFHFKPVDKSIEDSADSTNSMEGSKTAETARDASMPSPKQKGGNIVFVDEGLKAASFDSEGEESYHSEQECQGTPNDSETAVEELSLEEGKEQTMISALANDDSFESKEIVNPPCVDNAASFDSKEESHHSEQECQGSQKDSEIALEKQSLEGKEQNVTVALAKDDSFESKEMVQHSQTDSGIVAKEPSIEGKEQNVTVGLPHNDCFVSKEMVQGSQKYSDTAAEESSLECKEQNVIVALENDDSFESKEMVETPSVAKAASPDVQEVNYISELECQGSPIDSETAEEEPSLEEKEQAAISDLAIEDSLESKELVDTQCLDKASLHMQEANHISELGCRDSHKNNEINVEKPPLEEGIEDSVVSARATDEQKQEVNQCKNNDTIQPESPNAKTMLTKESHESEKVYEHDSISKIAEEVIRQNQQTVSLLSAPKNNMWRKEVADAMGLVERLEDEYDKEFPGIDSFLSPLLSEDEIAKKLSDEQGMAYQGISYLKTPSNPKLPSVGYASNEDTSDPHSSQDSLVGSEIEEKLSGDVQQSSSQSVSDVPKYELQRSGTQDTDCSDDVILTKDRLLSVEVCESPMKQENPTSIFSSPKAGTRSTKADGYGEKKKQSSNFERILTDSKMADKVAMASSAAANTFENRFPPRKERKLMPKNIVLSKTVDLSWFSKEVLKIEPPALEMDTNISEAALSLLQDREHFNCMCNYVADRINEVSIELKPGLKFSESILSSFDTENPFVSKGSMSTTSSGDSTVNSVEQQRVLLKPVILSDITMKLSNKYLAANFVSFLYMASKLSKVPSPFGDKNPFLAMIVSSSLKKIDDREATATMQELIFAELDGKVENLIDFVYKVKRSCDADMTVFAAATIVVDQTFESREEQEIENDFGRRFIVPESHPSPFETSILELPRIITAVVSFLGDPAALCRMKAVNKSCKRIIEDNEHKLMQDAVRIGGIDASLRPAFWMWIALEKCGVSSRQKNFTGSEEFNELEREAEEGKWHNVIQRDVARSFGNMPPHKTGAKFRSDSIVTALVTWGQNRIMKRGVKGGGEPVPTPEIGQLNTQKQKIRRKATTISSPPWGCNEVGDASVQSDASSDAPTDTVSDWSAVSPKGSFVGSVNDPETLIDESTEEIALCGNLLSADVKADLQNKLSYILHSLAATYEDIGYCQGMDYVVAHLLRNLQDTIRLKAAKKILPAIVSSASSVNVDLPIDAENIEMINKDIDSCHVVEETIVRIMDTFFVNYNLRHMYWPELRCLKTCCRVFERLIQIKLPVLADHFEHHDLNVGLFALGWFQTLFLYLPSMPSATVCHMWDIWLVERSFKIFFRVGTAILFLSQPILLNHELEGMMTYLNTIPDATLLRPDILIPCALNIKVTNQMLQELEDEIMKNPY